MKVKTFATVAMLAIASTILGAKPQEKEITKPISVNAKEFSELIFDYKNNTEWKYIGDKPAIIDFWAPWCGPCRQVAPSLEELADEYSNQIYVYKVNVDKEHDLAQTFSVESIPLILFVPMKGTPKAVLGAASKSQLREALEDMLKTNSSVK